MAANIIWEEKGVLIKHSGTVTDEEVRMINDMIYGDIRYDSIIYEIADYTDVTTNLLTPGDAKIVGTLDRMSSGWCAKTMKKVVVTKDKKFIPIVKTYFRELEDTEWECRIFDTLELAYEWVRSE